MMNLKITAGNEEMINREIEAMKPNCASITFARMNNQHAVESILGELRPFIHAEVFSNVGLHETVEILNDRVESIMSDLSYFGYSVAATLTEKCHRITIDERAAFVNNFIDGFKAGR